MLSFLFSKKNFDLVLFLLLIISSAIIYNPFTEIHPEKSQINLALISCLLLQMKKIKITELIMKKEN